MARPYWTGQISLSLVSFAVEIYPAVTSTRPFQFHQIDRATGEVIRLQATAEAPEAAPALGEELRADGIELILGIQATAARREFAEELGSPAPEDLPIDLGEVRQRSGKLVRAWAAPGDLDATAIASNTFTLEWPPRSGRFGEFPEVDRAQWFTLEQARERINPGQVPLLERLEDALR